MRYYDPAKINLSRLVGLVEIHPDNGGKFIYAKCVANDGFVYITDASILDERISEREMASRLGEGDCVVHVECDKFNASYVRNLRDYLNDVRGRSVPANVAGRIEAHSEFIRDRFLFRKDYDDDDGYSRFVESVLDYKDKSDIEAICVLSALAERIKNNT